MDFKASRTYQNLQKAYEGELIAGAKYEIYGLKAREEGFEQIGDIFDETSRNEREHGEIWLKLLNEGEIPDTRKNLIDAASGENYEWTQMYRTYARIARLEGYDEIAEKFDMVAMIEENHDRQYEKLYYNMMNGKVFCKNEEHFWVCKNCGNVWFGNCAPETCPVCGYPQGYYELKTEIY